FDDRLALFELHLDIETVYSVRTQASVRIPGYPLFQCEARPWRKETGFAGTAFTRTGSNCRFASDAEWRHSNRETPRRLAHTHPVCNVSMSGQMKVVRLGGT